MYPEWRTGKDSPDELKMNSPFQLALSWGDFLLRRNLKHLIVHVTNHCNFRCAHCFVDFETKKRDLPKETYFEIAKDTGTLFWLDIGGGEPFIRKDLAEIINAFRFKIVHIPSNGSLPDQMLEQLAEIRRQNPSAEILIGLSLDGLADTHDQLRGEPGSYEQVWRTYEEIRRHDPKINIKITTVITNKTVEDVLPLMREVRARKADFHSVILLRGTPPAPDVMLPPMPELRKLGPRIFELLEGYQYGRFAVTAHVLRNYHRYLWNVSLDILEKQTQVIPCYAGQSHMVVWADGTVSSCEMLPGVGNVKEKTFKEVLKSPELAEQRRAIRNKECHCTHNCAMLTSILFNPASLPQLVHQPIQT
jgi:MoaA/NifB/PqqE/SkfB family radical SAM enzyme